jgi:hypothetical protein
MNKHLLIRASLVAVVVSMVGCGDSQSNLYRTVIATQSAAIGTVCECFDSLGYASAAACEAEYVDAQTPTQITCLEEAYDTYRAELQPTAECELAALSDAQGCVEEVNACDETAIDACLEASDVGMDACPQVTSVPARTAVQACFN